MARILGVLLDYTAETFQIKTSDLVSTTEIACADLPDQIASMQVMPGDAPFACVVPCAGEGAATVDGLHSRRAETAKAHGRKVDGRGHPQSLPSLSMRSQHLCAGDPVVRRIHWKIQRKRAVFDEDVVRRLLEIVVRSETEVIVLLLGRCVNPPTLIPGEGAFFVVVRDDVLA